MVAMLAGLMLLSITNLLKFFRANERLSQSVDMLSAIFMDMRYFFLIQVLFISAFGCFFFVIHSSRGDVGPFSTLFGSFHATYMLGFFGDTDAADNYAEESASPMFNNTVVIMVQVSMTIVMLNALIAIMGDSHDRAQDQRAVSTTTQLCQLTVEYLIDSHSDSQLKDGLTVNWRWLHILERQVFEESDVEPDWEGRINTIRRMVDKLDSKITARADSVDDAHRQLDRKLDAIITHLGARK
jgi:hypothetical protein